MNPAVQLRYAHLLGLWAIAGWLAWAHPGGWLPAVVVALIAAGGEFLPRGVWRELGAPILTLFAAAAAWALTDAGRGAVHALLGTLVAALLLIPARPGVLRLLAPMAVLELVILGLPGSVGPRPWTAALVLAPLACLALAVDAWLEARLAARGATASAWRAWLGWALVPALAAAALGVGAFAPATAVVEAVRPAPVRRPADAGTPLGTQPERRSGDAVGIDPSGPPPRDPTPVARLFLPSPPPPRQLHYLRMAACSFLQRDLASGRLRWMPAHGERELPENPEPPPRARLGSLVRMAGLGDVVLLPDDGDWAGVPEMWLDGDGNRWRLDLGQAIRSYQVALDGPPRREGEADLALAAVACRELPPVVADWPWAMVEDPDWRRQPPEQAAAAISALLRARCAYDLKPPESSEPLATFLFGEERDRRGVCGHFSGAATMLLRRAGHAARAVAGFASAEWDGESVVFRRLHAHAWTEVLLPDGTWRRVDPTPPLGLELAGSAYDPETAPPPAAAEAVPLTRHQARSWPWPVAALILAALAVVVIAHRRHGPRRDEAREALRRHGAELVDLARGLGLRVAPHDTAAALCRRITERTGTDLGAALAAYERARFGDGPPPPPWPPLAEVKARKP